LGYLGDIELKLSVNFRPEFAIAPAMECNKKTTLRVWGGDQLFSEDQMCATVW